MKPKSLFKNEIQKTKVCKVCKIEKSIEDFAPNQYGKNNRVLRRPVCRECYSKKVKINPQQKKDFEKKHPRPNIGEEFTCPICQETFIREHKNDVVLDHSHKDGSVRGWVCSSCNTSIGKFDDDPNMLQRAIKWIETLGKSVTLLMFKFFH
jgi:hypothetical protein